MRTNQTLEICKNTRLHVRWTVLQHLHAHHGIVVAAVRTVMQFLDRREAHVVGREPSFAVSQLLDVHVGACRFAEQIVSERDEGSVATAVIEQRPAGACRGELARQRKAAAVAPGDDRVPAEDLFPGIVPLLQQLRGSSHIWFIGRWGIHLKGRAAEPGDRFSSRSSRTRSVETMGGEEATGPPRHAS